MSTLSSNPQPRGDDVNSRSPELEPEPVQMGSPPQLRECGCQNVRPTPIHTRPAEALQGFDPQGVLNDHALNVTVEERVEMQKTNGNGRTISRPHKVVPGGRPRGYTHPQPDPNSPSNPAPPKLEALKSKAPTILRRLTSKLRLQPPPAHPAQVSPFSPAVTTGPPLANAFTSKEQRDAALRARGLIPAKDLSAQEKRWDGLQTVVLSENLDQGNDEKMTAAKKIKDEWEARNRGDAADDTRPVVEIKRTDTSRHKAPYPEKLTTPNFGQKSTTEPSGEPQLEQIALSTVTEDDSETELRPPSKSPSADPSPSEARSEAPPELPAKDSVPSSDNSTPAPPPPSAKLDVLPLPGLVASTASSSSSPTSSDESAGPATVDTPLCSSSSPGEVGGAQAQVSIPVIVESPVEESFVRISDDVIIEEDAGQRTPREALGLGNPKRSMTTPNLIKSEDGAERKSDDAQKRERRKSFGIFKKKDAGEVPIADPPSSSKRRPSFADLRKSVVGTLSGSTKSRSKPKLTLSPSASVPTRSFNVSHLPPSPTLPVSLSSYSNSSPATSPTSPNLRTGLGVGLRQPLSPTIHSRGSILLETKGIQDDESRRLSEMAFLC